MPSGAQLQPLAWVIREPQPSDLHYPLWSPKEGQAGAILRASFPTPTHPGLKAPLTLRIIQWQYSCFRVRWGN